MTARILIADDLALFRELGALFLARCGEVVSASDGREAWKLVCDERPDVLIADVGLPLVSGTELCRRIRADRTLAGIAVVLTLPCDGSRRAAAVRAGADDVLEKPLSRQALSEAVSRLLHGRPVKGLPRVSLDLPLWLQRGGEWLPGRLKNLSRGGAFVECPDPVPRPGEEWHLRFDLAEDGVHAGALDTTAEVVWRRTGGREGCGAGVRFLDMEARQMRVLNDFVYERQAPAAWVSP